MAAAGGEIYDFLLGINIRIFDHRSCRIVCRKLNNLNNLGLDCRPPGGVLFHFYDVHEIFLFDK
ncbi:MAG: hypothetical protein JW384_01573 [Nitrosomonadaceae bacterium]|nr:hypothetical protein [Nitrosomonadaceae bacterium]